MINNKTEKYIPEYPDAEKSKERRLNCNKCQEYLGSLIITERPIKINPLHPLELPFKYKAQCPCGGETFIVKSNTQAFFLPSDHHKLQSINTYDNLSIAKVIKCQ